MATGMAEGAVYLTNGTGVQNAAHGTCGAPMFGTRLTPTFKNCTCANANRSVCATGSTHQLNPRVT